MIKLFEQYVDENIWQETFTQILNEAKKYSLPTIQSVADMLNFLIDNKIKSNIDEKGGWAIFYKEYNGTHIYLRLGQENWVNEPHLRPYATLWISKENKKPTFFNKVNLGNSTETDITFDFLNGEIYINKSKVDEFFGKPMPVEKGTPETVARCLNSYLQELATLDGSDWTLVKTISYIA